ncbi:MAG: hypothetical protein KAW92_12055 [Candidatus Cloacimonetes bacterium]|nr:hypothetical protein [Candidatus Cloacimonadota bacterium]
MNTGQMLALIFAIALFSAIVMSVNYSMLNQSELVYRGMFIIQGQRIAEKYFDKMEAELFGNIVEFDDLEVSYPDTTVSVEGINYDLFISAHYSDSLGTDFPDTTNIQRVDIKIYCSAFTDTIRFDRLIVNIE